MTGLCVRGWPASQPPPLPAPSYPPFPLAHHVHACLPTTCTPACPPHARLLDHHMQACLTTPCTPACPPHACLLAHHMHACLPTTCTPACCCPPHAHLLAHPCWPSTGGRGRGGVDPHACLAAEDEDEGPIRLGHLPPTRLLVCAQSNAAIDELIMRMAGDGVWRSDGSRRYGVTQVQVWDRVGMGSRRYRYGFMQVWRA